MIAIAHRLSTVIGADVIHVVDAGRIVESGTHATLIAQDGLYAELAAQQLAASRILEVEATEPAGALPTRRADRAPDDPAPLPIDDPLWHHPKVLITPHVASYSLPATAADGVVDNVRRALAGQPLRHQVDRARGY